MTSLQLGLIVAGVVLVVGVLVYNWLQERRVRRRIREAFPDTGASAAPRVTSGRGSARVEPTLARSDVADAIPENPPGVADAATDDAAYEPPLEIQARIATDLVRGARERRRPAPVQRRACRSRRARARPRHRVHRLAAAVASGQRRGASPPDCTRGSASRCAGSAAQRRHAVAAARSRIRRASSPRSSPACCSPIAAARRARSCIDAFARLAGSVASSLPAAFVPPGLRARSGAGRGARSHLRRPRRADRPHGAEDGRRDDRGHAAARRGRSGGFPVGRQRPLRVGAGRHRRGAVFARRTTAPSRSPPTACALRRRPASCSCSTCRASPIRPACSTR